VEACWEEQVRADRAVDLRRTGKSAGVGVVVDAEVACFVEKSRRWHACCCGWACNRDRRSDLEGANERDMLPVSIGYISLFYKEAEASRLSFLHNNSAVSCNSCLGAPLFSLVGIR
jgi:hypothetical protein